MLENLNLARKYAHTYSFIKYTFQYEGSFNFADVTIFFAKNQRFWQKQYLHSKQQCESCVRDVLVLFSIFVKQQVTVFENITFANSASEIQVLDCSKLAISQKNDNGITIFQHDVIVKFFYVVLGFLVKFSYSSKFHVNIITGSGIMTISFV